MDASRIFRNMAGAAPACGLYLHGGRGGPRFYSYAQLIGMIAETMAALRAQGLDRRSRVVVPFETDLETICGFLAAIGIGAVPLSVKPLSVAGGRANFQAFVQSIARRFRASHVLGAEHVPGLTAVQTPRHSAETPVHCAVHSPDVSACDPGDVAFVQFSSGTTAEPKGVPIAHGKLLEQLEIIFALNEVRPDDVAASWLPLYHDMGLIGALLTCFYAARSLHLSTPADYLLDPVDWLQRISTHAVTSTVMPSFGIRYLLRRLERVGTEELEGLRLDRLRRMFLGSDLIDADSLEALVERLAPYGLRQEALCPCYGMAEAVLMVSCRRPGELYRVEDCGTGKVTSVGPVLPQFELRVLRGDGRACAAGEVGEILLKGGTLATGYFEDGPLPGQDGYYATGDLGYVRDGELYITGRCGDRIKLNGQSYFLTDFERAAESLRFVRPGGAAAFHAQGELLLLLELGSDWAARPHAALGSVIDTVIERTGIKLDPSNVFMLRRGQLLKTSSGKLRRAATLRAFLRNELVRL